MPVAGEQPHAVAVALDDQAVAVMLDFVQPVVGVRHLVGGRRNTRLERGFEHGVKIGGDGWLAKGGEVRFALPAQPVDATQALNLSAGVSNCKVSRGRSLS
jgi:hypothetical protein